MWIERNFDILETAWRTYEIAVDSGGSVPERRASFRLSSCLYRDFSMKANFLKWINFSKCALTNCLNGSQRSIQSAKTEFNCEAGTDSIRPPTGSTCLFELSTSQHAWSGTIVVHPAPLTPDDIVHPHH